MPRPSIDHVATLLRGALALTLVGVAWGGDWVLAATAGWALALAAAPPLLARARVLSVAPAYDLVFLLLLSGHVYGHTLAFYHHVPHYDLILHLGAGGVLGATFSHVIRWWGRHHGGATFPPAAVGLVAVTSVVAWGAGWEMLEFGVDGVMGLNNQQGNADTMLDLIADFAGGAGGALVGARGATPAVTVHVAPRGEPSG